MGKSDPAPAESQPEAREDAVTSLSLICLLHTIKRGRRGGGG